MITQLLFTSLVGATITAGGAGMISESTPITIKFFVGGCVTLTGAAYYLGRAIQKGNDQREATVKEIHSIKAQMNQMDTSIKNIESRCGGGCATDGLDGRYPRRK